MHISGYDTGDWFDEVFDASGNPRPAAQLLLDIIHSQPEGEFERLQETANAAPLSGSIRGSATATLGATVNIEAAE